jgi:predicted nucleotide-binding protein
MQAGIIIAELSTPKPNVFYELGLVHALGKDTIVLKESTVELPADFRGGLYIEYVRGDENRMRADLRSQLERWKTKEGVRRVATLYGVQEGPGPDD